MSDPVPAGPGEARLRALYEAKVRAELADADEAAGAGQAVPWAGDPLASIAAVKGEQGPAERAGGAAFSGPDGEALRKGLAALDETRPVFLMCSALRDGGDDALTISRLRTQLASVDPSVVLAVDAKAAADVAAALGSPDLTFGVPRRVDGTLVLALEGLEASLAEERRKTRVWRQLKALRDDEAGARA